MKLLLLIFPFYALWIWIGVAVLWNCITDKLNMTKYQCNTFMDAWKELNIWPKVRYDVYIQRKLRRNKNES